MQTITEIIKTATAKTLTSLAEQEAKLSESKRAMLIMNRILKLRASTSAAILYHAYVVKRDMVFVDQDFNDQEFGLWLDQVIDRGTRYTLYATTNTFSASMGPWLDRSHVTCPITARKVTPMYLLEKAGYSKIMDVRAAWNKLERDDDQLGMGKIIQLILTKSRADLDTELKNEGLRESKAALIPDGLWNKPYSVVPIPYGEKGTHTVVVGCLTLDQAEYLVSGPLRKFISPEPALGEHLLEGARALAKEVTIEEPAITVEVVNYQRELSSVERMVPMLE